MKTTFIQKAVQKIAGLALVITAIAFNILLVTGCDDGSEIIKKEYIPQTIIPFVPPEADYDKIELKAERWTLESGESGENWNSYDIIGLSDLIREFNVTPKKGDVLKFKISGTSDVELKYIRFEVFNSLRNTSDKYLGGSSYLSNLTENGLTFNDYEIETTISNDPVPGSRIYIQIANALWHKSIDNWYYFENETLPSDVLDDTVMATISNFKITLVSIRSDTAAANGWWKSVAPDSTAQLTYSVNNEGVCAITVTGVAEPHANGTWNAWKAQVGYSYNTKANLSYEYIFEAWTQSGTRDLHLQYYEDNTDGVYLGDTIPITTTRKTYTVRGNHLPKNRDAIRFQCADTIGTLYLKIIEIREYKIGRLTITNFSGGGEHGIVQGMEIYGDALISETPNYDGDNYTRNYLSFNSSFKWDGNFNTTINGSTINIPVWLVTEVRNADWDLIEEQSSFTPFTGTITIPAGRLTISQWRHDNWEWTRTDDYKNKVPITFTNGIASIDFNSNMEWESSLKTSECQLTITGINDKSGDAVLEVYSGEYPSIGYGVNISDNSINIGLIIFLGTGFDGAFNGAGSYYLMLYFYTGEGSERFVYTNGGEPAVKYNISIGENTVDFSKFKKVE